MRNGSRSKKTSIGLKLVKKKNLWLGVAGLLILFTVQLWRESPVGGLMLWMAVGFAAMSSVALLLPHYKDKCSIQGPLQVEKKAPCRFDIIIKFAKLSLIGRGGLYLEIENLLTGEKDQKVISISVSGDRSFHKALTVEEPWCGALQIRAVEIRWLGFLGILYKTGSIEVTGESIVLPGIFPIEDNEDIWDSYDMESHKYSQITKGGDPGEVFALREYMRGDNLRQIHWKLSGKLSEIIVKEPSLPVDNKIMILLDKDGRSIYSPEHRSKSVELCGSLSFKALKKGLDHSIGWYDHINRGFRTHSIKQETDLWTAMEEIMYVGFWEKEESTAYRYIEADLTKHYRNILLVSEKEEDEERLNAYGQVHLYRPSTGH